MKYLWKVEAVWGNDLGKGKSKTAKHRHRHILSVKLRRLFDKLYPKEEE